MDQVQEVFSFPPTFQLSVLSYLFHDNNLFRKFSRFVETSYFSEFQFRDILEITLKFFNKYQEVPNKTSLLNEINNLCIRTNGRTGIEDYQDYINELYLFKYNKEYVQDQIIRFIEVQSVYNGLKEAYQNMHDGDKVLEIMTKAVNLKEKLLFKGGYNYKKEINTRIHLLEHNIRAQNQVPTGINDLDLVTSGGLGSGEIGCVIAQTGIGKTIYLQNLAIDACMKNFNVFYATMESGEIPLAKRFDGKVSSYTEAEMKDRIDKLKTAVQRLRGELIIKEFSTAVTTPEIISSYANDLLVNGFKFNLILIDYIGVMAASKRFKDLRHSIQFICQTIIGQIAKRFGVPVWTAHQSSDVVQDNDLTKLVQMTKKENVNKVIGISGIAEAKVALSSECDFLISLNQNAMEKSQVPQGLRIHVMKNRLGPTGGTFHMTIDKQRFVIKEAAALNLPGVY